MKKGFAILLSVLLLVGIIPASSFAAEIVDSGTYGENLTWTLDDEGTLSICGTGPMYYYNGTPWKDENASIKTVIIQNGVTQIAHDAFRGCLNLTDVTIPDSVTSIGDYAFYGCTGLTSVAIPDSVTSIGDLAFYGCEELVIPDAVSAAIDYIYSGSTGRLDWQLNRLLGILTINCPGKMPTFSSSDVPWAGGTYKDLVYVAVIEDGATSIGQFAFSGCTSLASVTIPDSVTSIGNYAFFGCAGLTSVTIPDSVTSIGDSVFYGCTGLTSVTIPDSVTSIGNYAFSGCTGLTSVTIPDSVTSIGEYAFYCCTRLTSVTIPDSVTSIGNDAFIGCTGLTSVTIPDSVTWIGYYAFSGCTGLTSVDIPASVRTVYGSAFGSCANLESIYYYNPTCYIESGVTPTSTVIYGYAGSTAETYADDNGLIFREIDGNHEHKFVVTKTVPATCTEDGYRNLACPCGERTTETIPAPGHTAVNVPATEPTCTQPGYSAYTYCSVCEAILTERTETPAAGHTETTVNAIEATCGKAGFTGVTYCSVCEKVLSVGTVIPATGEHTGTIVGMIEATCGQDGFTGRTYCTACEKVLSEGTVIPATGDHTETIVGAIPALCGRDGFTGVTYCTVCQKVLNVGTSIPATGEHTSGETEETILAAPTCSTLGQKKMIVRCSVCDETLLETTELIAKTEHIDTDNDGICDNCEQPMPAAEQPENPSGTGSQSFFSKILAFLRRIVEFFTGLFGRK